MESEFSINERVVEVMKQKNLSASQFADEMGVNRATISQLCAYRNKPSVGFLMNLLSTYPDIDANWLLLGAVRITPTIHKQQDLEIFEEKSSNSEENFQIEENEKKTDIFSETHTATKKIEKIVTFYSDKTFTEYYPAE